MIRITISVLLVLLLGSMGQGQSITHHLIRRECRQDTRAAWHLCLTRQVVYLPAPPTTDAEGRQIDCVVEHFVQLGRPDVMLCGVAFP